MPSASIQKPAGRGSATWLAFLLTGLFNYMLTALGASSERLRSDLGVSRGLVGLHATCFAAGIVLAGLTGARLSRRYGRRPMIVGGAVGMAAGALLLALSHTPLLSLGAAFAMGTSGSLLLVLLPALLTDLHGPRSGEVLAEANSLSSFFAAFAPFAVGAAVAVGVGWRGALLLGSAALLGTAVAFWLTTRGTMAAPREAEAGVPGVSQRLPAAYWGWWATLVLVVCVEFSIVFWTPDELRTVAAVPPALAAGAVTIFELALAAGRLVGSQALRRTGGPMLLRVGLLTAALGFGLYWSAGAPSLALGALGIVGVGVAMLYPISLAAAIAAADGRSDLASARAALGSGLAVGLAPFVFGLFADARGVHTAFLLVPLLLLGAWATSALGERSSRTRIPAAAGAGPQR
jgi:predicted MFS family arabinose efflux permease